MHNAASPEVLNFLRNFKVLHSKILSKKPYFLIFTGDFNAHSVQWLPNGDNNNEGTQLNILFSELGLTQLISEPIHFREHCCPSCIDLIICDQPNLVIDRWDMQTPIAPSKRLVWQYDRAKCHLINRAN